MGAQARVVTVTGHHQQVDVLGNCSNDLALDPPPTLEKLGVLTAEPRRSGGEQLGGGGVGDILEGGGGSASSKRPAEQPRRGRAGTLGDIGRGDVEEGDLGS